MTVAALAHLAPAAIKGTAPGTHAADAQRDLLAQFDAILAQVTAAREANFGATVCPTWSDVGTTHEVLRRLHALQAFITGTEE